MAVWHVADGGIDWRSRDRWRCNRSRRMLESIRAMKKASRPVVMLTTEDSTTINGKLITIVHHYLLLRVSIWLRVQLILADVFIGSGTGTRDGRRSSANSGLLREVRPEPARTGGRLYCPPATQPCDTCRGTGCRVPNDTRQTIHACGVDLPLTVPYAGTVINVLRHVKLCIFFIQPANWKFGFTKHKHRVNYQRIVDLWCRTG